MDIDGVQAILAALAAAAGAGAGDAVKDTTKSALTGARDQLVRLVRGRLHVDPVGEAKLTVYAAEPTAANAEALHEHLVTAGVGQDRETVELAQQILSQVGPTAIGPGSVAAAVINQINEGTGHTHIGGVQHYGTPPDPS
jgi:hypothetical protein